MKKEVLVIGIISLFLLLSFSSISTVGKNAEVTKRIQQNDETGILNITGIIGYVFDEETGKPIENAWAFLYTNYYYTTIIGNIKIKLPWIETTNSSKHGAFYLSGKLESENIVFVGKFGYKIQKQEVEFPSGEETVGIEFFLKSRF